MIIKFICFSQQKKKFVKEIFSQSTTSKVLKRATLQHLYICLEKKIVVDTYDRAKKNM